MTQSHRCQLTVSFSSRLYTHWCTTLYNSQWAYTNKNNNQKHVGGEPIDDERQLKTAKRPQAPGDATVLKRFFLDNFVTFHHRSKGIAFLESVIFSTFACVQIFNFRNDHMTTFQHSSGAYISQMPGHRLSRLANGTPSESRLSISTIGLR